MNKDLLLFTHTYTDNKARKTILALHGTGGDEDSFSFLNQALDNQYNIIGIRGNITENGMNRYFRRFALGVFDEENVRAECAKLQTFIKALMQADGTQMNDYIYLGYSNGANMILASLILYPDTVKQFILLHPMLPLKPDPSTASLSEASGFVSYGLHDTMVTEEQSRAVIEFLEAAGATLTVDAYDGGHGLSEDEMQSAIQYIQSL